tara:strand:- start:547 stop:1011 length:465 start_codon:yes stop_codon:yes gene_type:complete
MKEQLIILLSFTLLFTSCRNNTQKHTIQDSITNTIVSFSVTSKNSELTSKSGKDVLLNEMTTINVKSGDKILFKAFDFTLENNVDGALNFYSDNGRLMCNVPTKLSIMSMPPSGKGLTNYNKGDVVEISAMTLIKIESVNFVISNIIHKNEKVN